MAKSQAQRIFNLKLSEVHHQFIARMAKAQGHGNKSLVVKKLIERDMEHQHLTRLTA